MSVPPLSGDDAVALFCERAQTEASEEIAELCRRLDNLPLAVELAAARTKALSPPQILDRLSDRLDLLEGGRDADPRQQTLRATIEWSYDLLAHAEQDLFGRLSVFVGGCTLEAAEEVADADLDTLQSLVEKSLLRFGGERYWMLETIREFASERLAVSGETDVRFERLGRYLATCARAEGGPLFVEGQAAAFARFDSEHANTRTVMAWALGTGREDLAADLIAVLVQVWLSRGHGPEANRWIDAVLASRPQTSESTWAQVLNAASDARKSIGDVEGAVHVAEELADMAAIPSIDPLPVAAALADLSDYSLERGEMRRAREYAQRSLEYRNAHGLPGARALSSLAGLALATGDLDRAEDLFERASADYVRIGHLANHAGTLMARAEIERQRGNYLRATQHLVECLEIEAGLGDENELGKVLKALALVASDEERLERAGKLWGAGEGIHERANAPRAARQLQYGRAPELPANAVRIGAAMELDEALDYARSSLD